MRQKSRINLELLRQTDAQSLEELQFQIEEHIEQLEQKQKTKVRQKRNFGKDMKEKD